MVLLCLVSATGLLAQARGVPSPSRRPPALAACFCVHTFDHELGTSDQWAGLLLRRGLVQSDANVVLDDDRESAARCFVSRLSTKDILKSTAPQLTHCRQACVGSAERGRRGIRQWSASLWRGGFQGGVGDQEVAA